MGEPLLPQNKSGQHCTVRIFHLMIPETCRLSGVSDSKASAAVNGLALLGSERYLCFAAAVCANTDKGLTAGTLFFLAGLTAVRASLGVVLKALFGIELLLTCCKYEFVAAAFTY